ncbi:hypothetical protein GCM10022219_12660 [Microbacterium oryzae]|nr:glycosyl hydrolase [Microbacterium oryzae]
MALRRVLASEAVAALTATLLASCASVAPSAPDPEPPTKADLRERAACAVDSLADSEGVAFGVNLDWGSQSVKEYADLLGRQPADVVSFVPLPWDGHERQWALEAAQQAAVAGSAHLLTIEPQDGLAAVDDAAVADLVTLLQEVTELGVPVVLRFAHEMNGSWYAWGQQPDEYVDTFRRVASAVHDDVPGAAMMWAPNYGGGYPFTGGAYMAEAGTPAARALDTDGDGAVTDADDPYAPYYPGDEYVDWVGMSLYHWGSAYPWGENEVPEEGKFAAQLTGTYSGLGGDDSAIPDFYAEYGERRDKPVAIPETAALVVERGEPESEAEIKRAWWRQVLAPETREVFPMLRMINWFEWTKLEPEVDDTVAWSVLSDEMTAAEFTSDLPEWLRFAGDVHCGE